MVDQRLRADHERRPALAPRELELERGAGGDHLGQRGVEAEPPQLAHELLRCVADVVGEEQHRGARVAQRGDRVDGAVARLVADPHAPVEVEQYVVVAADAWRDGHAPCLSSPPMLRVLILCLALRAAGRGVRRGRRRRRRGGRHAGADRGGRPGRLRGRRGARAEGRGQAAQAEGDARPAPRPTSPPCRPTAATSRSRSTPSAPRRPAARSSRWPTRASTTAPRSTASWPAS